MNAQTRPPPSPLLEHHHAAASPQARGIGGASDRLPFQQVLVWDAPTRVAHWLMAACFVGAWLTAGQARWQWLHETLGWTLCGLALFRIGWGFVGTRHARFASFVRGPVAIARCLQNLPRGCAKRHIGHSPAGAILLIAILLLALVVGVTGGASGSPAEMSALGGLHEAAAVAMLALALLHLVAVVCGSWRAGEHPARSMIGGTKLGEAGEAIPSACRGVAWLLVAAVLGFWLYQWNSAGDIPDASAPVAVATPAAAR